MANICIGSIKVVLPTINEKDFLSHFSINCYEEYVLSLFDISEITENCQQTNIEIDDFTAEEFSSDEKFVALTFIFECRGSLNHANLKFTEDTNDFITLESLFKKYDVIFFYAKGVERGCGFEEQIEYKKDISSNQFGIKYNTRDYWLEADDCFIHLNEYK